MNPAPRAGQAMPAERPPTNGVVTRAVAHRNREDVEVDPQSALLLAWSASDDDPNNMMTPEQIIASLSRQPPAAT